MKLKQRFVRSKTVEQYFNFQTQGPRTMSSAAGNRRFNPPNGFESERACTCAPSTVRTTQKRCFENTPRPNDDDDAGSARDAKCGSFRAVLQNSVRWRVGFERRRGEPHTMSERPTTTTILRFAISIIGAHAANAVGKERVVRSLYCVDRWPD